ncbi:MAG: sodium:calcium antiporter [Armatimonadota bacterium]
MPAWSIFLISAIAVIAAGSRLSRDGDTIADRTGLGGAWVGAILVAGATSLPELATDIFAVRQGLVPLAVGDLFGSSMANMLILAVADLSTRQLQVLTRVTINQVMVGLLAILLTVLAAAGVLAHQGVAVLNLGWAPLAIGLCYILGMRLLHVNRGEPPFESAEAAAESTHQAGPLKPAVVGFVLSALVILIAAPFLAGSAATIAEQLGYSTGLVGMVLLAITTSLPEVTVSVAAVRSGSYDLAVGNLLGSNAFNMFILVALDLVDGPGPLLARVGNELLVGALFAVLLMAQALLAVLNKSERRIWYLEPDAIFLVLTYVAGLYLTYRVGH